jgi:hypothetical protein
MKNINTNHPFTTKQLKALNDWLKKISNNQITALRSPAGISSKKDYSDIKLLHSPYLNDVFLSYWDMKEISYPKSRMIMFSPDGSVEMDPKKKMQFESLTARVEFFGNLEIVKFDI